MNYRSTLSGAALWTLLAMGSAGCAKFEASPNAAFDADSPRNLTQTNLNRLLATQPDDTLRFAFTGDTQGVYEDSEDLVGAINAVRGIDFTVIAGDLSDYGLRQEMEWVDRDFSNLTAPYLAVVGNHDIVANGEAAYRSLYGPLDFSFVYDSVRFVFHNTNGREYDFNSKVPDMGWMREKMTTDSAAPYTIAVAHVPPFDPDFDSKLEADYAGLMHDTKGLLACLHGHRHNPAALHPYNDGVLYLNSAAPDRRMFFVVDVVKGQLTYREIEF